MSKNDSLNIPPAALDDSESFEIARVWIAQETQHVTLRTQVWEDPAAWGIMLADLARHVAASYSQEVGITAEAAVSRILAGIKAELE